LSLLQANYKLLINRENQQHPHPAPPYPHPLNPDITADIYARLEFTVYLQQYTIRIESQSGIRTLTRQGNGSNVIDLYTIDSDIHQGDNKISWLVNGIEVELMSGDGHNAIRRNNGNTISLVTV